MVSLQDIKVGMNLEGLDPLHLANIVSVISISPLATQVIFRLPDGSLRERLLSPHDEASLHVATTTRPWSFDGDAATFQLAVEAQRIDLAFLFDPMMAVHASNVEPLPHQITAVYESMLPRIPLRYVLADDPGAGKTIMAGLLIRELIMRSDAHRILIVSPGSLVEQWRDELYEKFGLSFRVFSRDMESGNPFEEFPQLILRLDQTSRNEALKEKLLAVEWDLIIFDEAHKLSAHYFGHEIKRTKRFNLAESLGQRTRHLLLMTATPHNGKEEDFQLFLSLLDSDRFYGKFRDPAQKVDTSDIMRRMVKEELVRFDGTPLFPERKAYTVNYTLSELEMKLYDLVTDYVRTQMGKADNLDGQRRSSVGFALTTLQRRLASSPEAIFRSLRRRKEGLEKRLQEAKAGLKGKQPLAETLIPLPEDDDERDASEQEALEDALVNDASAAASITELAAEIEWLKALEVHAIRLVHSKQDRKWEELSRILQDRPELRDADGRLRKLIIFTEHRDTLVYLQERITGLLGNDEAVVVIHGQTSRDDRRTRQALFRDDPLVRILIATDAAGEGVNLQKSNLMVNYDLPWNPNRLEQRFGRIHRIGQDQVCHLWNLVAQETREGQVYHRLLDKLEHESKALKGKVFDILGDVFENHNLRELLIEAIRYGDRPDVHAKLTQKIDSALNLEHIQAILERNALAQETMSQERLFALKEEMDKAEARRLQPYFIRAFFLKAFEALGGSHQRREAGRLELSFVPSVIRERDRRIAGRNRQDLSPVLKRYERVCFTRESVRPPGKPGLTMASLLHPGHPLMLAMTDLLLERHANLVRQGTILLDGHDEGLTPSLLLLLTHEITSGDGQVISKRLQFVRVSPDGTTSFAGWAPHLDLEPLSSEDSLRVKPLLEAPWIRADLEQKAIALAASTLVPEHVQEVASRRITQVDKTLKAVHERLTHEIHFWTERWMKLKEDAEAGKDVRLPLENARRTLSDLETRLERRKKELLKMRHVASGTPIALGGAFVVPAGLLRKLRGEPLSPQLSADAEARAHIERLAMSAVRHAEETRGCLVTDVSAQKCGWDLTSYPRTAEGGFGPVRHIEVKGRVKGADTLTVTRNEILYALNQSEKFVLAIVLVNSDHSVDGPYYIRQPFQTEPGWGVASVNYDLKALLESAEKS